MKLQLLINLFNLKVTGLDGEGLPYDPEADLVDLGYGVYPLGKIRTNFKVRFIHTLLILESRFLRRK